MLNCFHFPPPRKSGPSNALPRAKGVPTKMMCKKKQNPWATHGHPVVRAMQMWPFRLHFNGAISR